MNRIVPALIATFAASCATGPKVVSEWRHIDGPVSDQRFFQDRGACQMEAQRATAGFPWQMKGQAMMQIFMPCMNSKGYEMVTREVASE